MSLQSSQVGEDLPEPEDASPGAVRKSPRAHDEPGSGETVVVKIGGSTLGAHDTTLKDLVELQRRGARPVVIHGGGKIISEWMAARGVRPKFVRGLRVTDSAVLEIVVAVLAGVVNKSLVSSIQALGGRAVGLSGVDGGLLTAKQGDPELGLVGGEVFADPELVRAVMLAGFIPVIAPVAARLSEDGAIEDSMLNVNADTAAGRIATALKADRLVFLTDVAGVLDSSRRVIPRLTEGQAHTLIRSNVVDGGMVPKLEACVTALGRIDHAQIIDGRRPGALLESLSGRPDGTRVG
jgi:acetylglutamate kinase